MNSQKADVAFVLFCRSAHYGRSSQTS